MLVYILDIIHWGKKKECYFYICPKKKQPKLGTIKMKQYKVISTQTNSKQSKTLKVVTVENIRFPSLLMSHCLKRKPQKLVCSGNFSQFKTQFFFPQTSKNCLSAK